MKAMILTLVLCLLVAGCGGSEKNCEYAAEIEYGKENIVKINEWRYLVKTPTKILIIYKGNLWNPRTREIIDVTEFVKGEPK